MAFTPERLLRALESSLDDLPATGLCVALSGGLDSTVLFSALADLREQGRLPWPLRAFHVDHSLHPDSARWSEACSALAAARAVEMQAGRVDAGAGPGESPEAAAREARYAALRQQLRPREVLLTAHHADDQLETILLQWLRGGGLQAVAGMARRAPFGPGWHARPLLDFTRAELSEWAASRGLAWLEDPSNRDPRYDRNYLRLEVLPALRARWPAAARTVARVGDFATDAIALEREIASADLEIVAQGSTLALPRLLRLPAARQRSVLRAWLAAQGLPLPAVRTLESLRHDAAAAASDRIPETQWPGAVVRRYRGRLYAERPWTGGFAEGPWRMGDSVPWPLGDGSSLVVEAGVGDGLSQARTPRELRVASRFDGAVFLPVGGAHRRPLRKWFQDRGVLPWRRDAVPLLCAGDEIVAIADISSAAPYVARPDEPSWRIRWQGRPCLTDAEALAANWRGPPSID